jgi:hypothetical protein
VEAQAQRLRANRFIDPAEGSDQWWFDLKEADGRLVVSGKGRARSGR